MGDRTLLLGIDRNRPDLNPDFPSPRFRRGRGGLWRFYASSNRALRTQEDQSITGAVLAVSTFGFWITLLT